MLNVCAIPFGELQKTGCDLRGCNFPTLFRLFSWFGYTLERVILSILAARQILYFCVVSAQDFHPAGLHKWQAPKSQLENYVHITSHLLQAGFENTQVL